MKPFFRLRFLLLSGALLLTLTACAPMVQVQQPSDALPSASPLPSSGQNGASSLDTSVEDLCLAAAGIPGDTELFTVNGHPVSARSYLYWLAYNTTYLESYLQYYGGSGIDWASDAADGVSQAEYLKQDALDAAVQLSLVANKPAELGLSLSEEQQAALQQSVDDAVEQMGGQEAFEDGLRKSGLDEQTFYDLNAASYYYDLLLNGLFQDRPTDEEVDQYIQDNDILYAKHILISTVDPATSQPLEESVIAEKKALAEDLLSQLQASQNLQADFDALMNEYSEDPGLASNPDGYTFTANQMVAEFESATRDLAYGEISGLVESSYGYHIILRLDPDTESLRSQLRSSLLDEQISTWAEEAQIELTEAYENLDVQSFYETFSAYQDAFQAESSEETANN